MAFGFSEEDQKVVAAAYKMGWEAGVMSAESTLRLAKHHKAAKFIRERYPEVFADSPSASAKASSSWLMAREILIERGT